MNGNQLSWILLLSMGGSLLGAIIEVILFGVGCWTLYSFGCIGKADAIFKVKIAIITFSVLGLVLGLVCAARRIH
jgi:hypothetical protein